MAHQDQGNVAAGVSLHYLLFIELHTLVHCPYRYFRSVCSYHIRHPPLRACSAEILACSHSRAKIKNDFLVRK